ncbi:MAG: hypothetical protein ACYC1Z_14825 [Georgenia sp.]
MLAIFAVAALALLAVGALVIGVPIMIVVALLRSRRQDPSQLAGADPDSEFAALVGREWPDEAALLDPTAAPGRRFGGSAQRP